MFLFLVVALVRRNDTCRSLYLEAQVNLAANNLIQEQNVATNKEVVSRTREVAINNDLTIAHMNLTLQSGDESSQVEKPL